MYGHVHMLDLGANVDCTPEQLVQFAIMGSILVTAVEGKPSPRIGLLNIGEEDIKGNETVKRAAELLRTAPLNYSGYVEGDEIYTGDVDVIVCDGFVGNVALKTSEGLVRMVIHFMRQEFKRNVLTKLSALAALPVLNAFKNVDPRRYNGASLVGLNGTVIKSHGGADRLAFEHAILGSALAEARKDVPRRIGEALATLQTSAAAPATAPRRCATSVPGAEGTGLMIYSRSSRHRQLPAGEGVDQRRPRKDGRHHQPMDRGTHRHPRAPHRRRR